MSTYKVSAATRKIAASLRLTVAPSSNPTKKIDVFQDGVLVARIGAAGMRDFHVWKRERGLEYALERRRLYHARHPYDVVTKDGRFTADFLAKKLLW